MVKDSQFAGGGIVKKSERLVNGWGVIATHVTVQHIWPQHKIILLYYHA